MSLSHGCVLGYGPGPPRVSQCPERGTCVRVYGPAEVDLFLVLLECLWKCLIERGYSEQQLGEDTGAGVETNLCGVIQTQDAACVLLMRKHDGVCTSADGYKQTALGHQTG